MLSLRTQALAALLLGVPLVDGADAEVTSFEVFLKEPVLRGRPMGDAGPYELVAGTVSFSFEPRNAANTAVVDIRKAVLGNYRTVRALADLVVLRPVDARRGSGTALLEVSNRGRKAALQYFQRATTSAAIPRAASDFGDLWLLEQGLTIIWVGWQFDVPRDAGILRLNVPRAQQKPPIAGLVRCDWVIDEPVRTLPLGHRRHIPYPAAQPNDARNVLTVRSGRDAAREVIPREAWRFAQPRRGELAPDRNHVTLLEGFEPGRIYELVYVAHQPAVVGLGLAAIRDTLSFAKYNPRCPFPVERGVGLGISQTGRFLRHFLWQGFNVDEEGRKVFDGVLIHSAGAGRGSFNHRFAQPSRDAHRYSAFFYPTDLFPFSGRVQRDPLTGRSDGVLAHLDPEHLPKVVVTNTGYEYWGRAASLVHTSLDGSADVEPLPNERLYHLASGQHYVGRFPPRDDARLDGPDGHGSGHRSNPLDFLVTLRALLDATLAWVEDDVEPPPSRTPRIDAGTLVPIDAVELPNVPGLALPEVVHVACRVDYGPDFEAGTIAKQPPELGPAFPSLVPQVDRFGNELGGVPTLETRLPLATYTPWSVRTGMAGGNGELVDFEGNVIPLPRTEAEREASGDERPSLEKVYRSREAYLERAALTAEQLVEERWLLPVDVPRVLERAAATWDWIEAP